MPISTFPWATTVENGVAQVTITTITGVTKTMPFPSLKTIGDILALEKFEEKYPHVKLIQDALPMLSNEEREFLITGLTPEEWHELFGEEE